MKSSLIPLRKERNDDVSVRPGGEWPLFSLHRDMDRLFDDFVSRFFGSGNAFLTTADGEEAMGAFLPRIDVRDSGRELIVSAELPGVEEKDLDLRINQDALILAGEKKSEHEETRGHWHCSECRHGAFRRVIPLPVEVVADQVSATFRNGVLTVSLPDRKSVV